VTYRKFNFHASSAIAVITGAVIWSAHPAQAQETYQIQRGDELGTIARRLEGELVGWRELCQLNSDVIADCDLLKIGTVIVLPEGTSMSSGDAETAESAAVSPAAQEVSALGTETTEPSQRAETEAANEPSPSRDLPVLMPSEDAVYSVFYGEGGLPLEFQTNRGHTIEAVEAGVLIAGHVAEANSTGRTSGAHIHVPDEFEMVASANSIRVTVELELESAEGTARAAYSTSDVGNSGWRSLDIDAESGTATFSYDVPPINNGNGDYLGIDPDPEGIGQSVVVSAILLEVLDANTQ
jgi:hypothetical protein